MELYEHVVLAYLTKDPFVFVSPQYSIRGDKGEWSCPDLVTLNFRERKVAVVEVSTAWNPKSLREKVEKRDRQWIDRLRAQLRSLSVIDDSWEFEVQLYIRKDAVPGFSLHVTSPGTPVKVTALEDLGAPWDWARG